MTQEQWAVLCLEIYPDMERLADYGEATEDYAPLCRVFEHVNQMLIASGLPPLATSDLAYYLRDIAARTPTLH